MPSPNVLMQVAHTVCFRFATFVPRVLLVSLLAKALTPAEYGAYSLIVSAVTLGSIVVGFSLFNYLYINLPGRPAAGRGALFRSTLQFEFLASSAVALAALAFRGPLTAAMGVASYGDAFVLGLVLLVATVASTELQHYLLATSNIVNYNYVDFLCQSAWVLPLLAYWAAGYPVSLPVVLSVNLAGMALGLGYGFSRVDRETWSSRLDWREVRAGVAFSVPMIVPALSFYLLKLGDRFVISYYHGLDEVGFYSFGWTFINTIYSFTSSLIMNVMIPYAVRAHNGGDGAERDRVLTRALKYSLAAYAAGVGLFIASARPLLGLIARRDYAASLDVLPTVAVGCAMLILAYPAHYLLLLRGKTVLIMLIDSAGLALCLGLNFLLVPRYSYHGAAVATALGFGVVAVVKHAATRSWGHIDVAYLVSPRPEIRYIRGLIASRGGRPAVGPHAGPP